MAIPVTTAEFLGLLVSGGDDEQMDAAKEDDILSWTNVIHESIGDFMNIMDNYERKKDYQRQGNQFADEFWQNQAHELADRYSKLMLKPRRGLDEDLYLYLDVLGNKRGKLVQKARTRRY